MRRYSIQTKIVLPFILLFIIVIFVAPLVTITLLTRKYDEQFSRVTKKWLRVIVETGYIEDPQKVTAAYDAEVMVFNSTYTLNYTTLKTLSDDDLRNLATSMKLSVARKQLEDAKGNIVLQNVTVGGKPYKVIYHPLESNRLYCLMRPMDEITDAKQQVTLLIFGIAAIAILLLTLISHLIAKNLATPIKELVQFTRQVAGGNLDGQFPVKTNDEIGDLTLAFNQMTRDLHNSRRELIHAERLATAGKMAASFAHEIRNPLSSIKMLTQILMRKRDIPEARREKSLRSILEEIERIDVIVKGFMDFARPTTLDRTLQPLNPVLQEVLELMEANLNHHRIALIRKLDPELPPLSFDRDKLKQVFMNIVLNAMEAMPEGGILEVLTTRDLERVRIDIVDTGAGIPEDVQERLFEPFFTTKPQGTGLGLANAKRILEQHGGDIQLGSRVGEGTTVSLWLPMSGI
jgi:signal transduction histidine kinase